MCIIPSLYQQSLKNLIRKNHYISINPLRSFSNSTFTVKDRSWKLIRLSVIMPMKWLLSCFRGISMALYAMESLIIKTDNWSFTRKLLTRFFFIYFILYIFPFPLDLLSDDNFIVNSYRQLWDKLVPFTGKHLLGINVGRRGSDTLFRYTRIFSYCVAAIAGAWRGLLQTGNAGITRTFFIGLRFMSGIFSPIIYWIMVLQRCSIFSLCLCFQILINWFSLMVILHHRVALEIHGLFKKLPDFYWCW